MQTFQVKVHTHREKQMALTKIGKEGITGVSNASNATFLTATSAEGVTLAGTLAVTGVHTVGNDAVITSEGGAVTSNIAQGACKQWSRVKATAVTVVDSFNTTSVTDSAVGRYAPVIANNMSNGNYLILMGGDDANDGAKLFVHNVNTGVTIASTGYATSNKSTNASSFDNDIDGAQNQASAIFGDLA